MHRLLRTATLVAAASLLAAGLLATGGRAPSQASGVCPYTDSSGCGPAAPPLWSFPASSLVRTLT